jgi:hypothetical protein
VFATQSGAKERRFHIFLDKRVELQKKIVVMRENVVMIGIWRVVSKVGKDGIEDIEGFEGFMHLVLSRLCVTVVSRSGSIKMRNQSPKPRL